MSSQRSSHVGGGDGVLRPPCGKWKAILLHEKRTFVYQGNWFLKRMPTALLVSLVYIVGWTQLYPEPSRIPAQSPEPCFSVKSCSCAAAVNACQVGQSGLNKQIMFPSGRLLRQESHQDALSSSWSTIVGPTPMSCEQRFRYASVPTCMPGTWKYKELMH